MGRLWPLLLPGAYALHLGEEIWGGPGFVAWAAEHLSSSFTFAQFAAINLVAWPAMLLASLAAIIWARLAWFVVPLATIVLVNGLIHLGSTVATATYAPGVVTGVLVYVPLGLYALGRIAPRITSRQMAGGVVAGLALHALVIALAFGPRL